MDSTPVDLRDLGFVGCRLVALYFGVQALLLPPAVLSAVNVGLTNVQIVYSEMVAAANATNVANYIFTNGLPVTGALLNPNNQTVTLTTSPLTYGSNYCLVINNVRDRAAAPNTIAPNTTVTFSALPYIPQDLGNPSVASVVTAAGNGLNVTAAGSDFGGSLDQGNFSYQTVSGNFDIAATSTAPRSSSSTLSSGSGLLSVRRSRGAIPNSSGSSSRQKPPRRRRTSVAG